MRELFTFVAEVGAIVTPVLLLAFRIPWKVADLHRIMMEYPPHRHHPAEGAGCQIVYPKGFAPEQLSE